MVKRKHYTVGRKLVKSIWSSELTSRFVEMLVRKIDYAVKKSSVTGDSKKAKKMCMLTQGIFSPKYKNCSKCGQCVDLGALRLKIYQTLI